MKRRGLVRRAVILAACVFWMAAAGDARDRKAHSLATKAKKLEDSVKDVWVKFAFEHKELTDKELKKIVSKYEKAADLYHKSLELEEHGAINGSILILARRIAQARMVEMSRAAPHGRGEKRPAADLPELEESKTQRRRGIQGVRNFIIHQYFANRKASSIRSTCERCSGAGRVSTSHRKPSGATITLACANCRESGLLLNVIAVRKGFWLCHSPLYRSDGQKQLDWVLNLQTWRNEPRKVPEVLEKLKILSVDYHGLWAEVTWEERGRKANKWPFKRTETRRVVRAGKRWFFYDEKLDRDFFAQATEASEPPLARASR